jgi:hypothetical protein
VLGHLDQLIDALPVLGAVGNSQHDVGLAASHVSKMAVKLRAGDPVGTSAADLGTKARELDELDRLGAAAMPLPTAADDAVGQQPSASRPEAADEPSCACPGWDPPSSLTWQRRVRLRRGGRFVHLHVANRLGQNDRFPLSCTVVEGVTRFQAAGWVQEGYPVSKQAVPA